MSTWSTFQKPNVGLLFYKHIYKEKSITNFVDIKKKIKASDEDELVILIPDNVKTSPFDEYYNDLLTTKANDFEQIENTAFNSSFTIYTTYPGLLVGSGYQHDTKAKGDFKIGFFFDHTTGQPVIPGSSVKGILRSLFELDIPEKGNAFTGQKSVEAIKFICDEIIETLPEQENEQKKWAGLKNNITIDSLRNFKIKIFGDDSDGKIMGTDIFFDSVINVDATGAASRIFSNDFITPHMPNPLKNPVPIQFLKVLPNIAFDFKFILHDASEWTAEIKEKLFKQILLTLGAGAKTNVGYGQFITEEDKKNLEQSAALKTEQEKRKPVNERAGDYDRGNNYKPKKDEKPEYNPLDKYKNVNKLAEHAKKETASDQWPDISDVKPKQGSITAKIIDIEGNNLIVQPYIKGLFDGYTLKIPLGKYDENPYKKDQIIQIQLTVKTGQPPNFVLQAKILK